MVIAMHGAAHIYAEHMNLPVAAALRIADEICEASWTEELR